jgi:hypothetical protein
MKRLFLTFVLVVQSSTVFAEQLQRLGNFDVHYILLPTTLLKPEVAASYGITRGRDRALLNISVLNRDQLPTAVAIEGHMTNLLGQRQGLEFKEVREGTAIYYLATIKYTDREVLRFNIRLTPPEDSTKELKFQQQMYWDGR